ncbi:tyrosine--tRNA ligase [Peptoniphilus duerdenii ATCC BAA-1640]|uniref:Tyrosine--tRNA ligase n=2 Tax=Peptoniphilus TaxID=162289 RepID=E0NNZ4_9FIRM|nr:tyrosine--tRNA ligase [Peptoniphilus duerdenii ATCC BAA-1640]
MVVTRMRPFKLRAYFFVGGKMNVIDILEERGFIDQMTHEEELRDLLGKEKVKFYIGFDATADSLTLGHFLQIRVMQHMQNAGHIPVALLGGGTTMIGDPSGKNDMRKVMTEDFINHNAECFRKQISHFLDFSEGKGIIENNKDWLLDLKFLPFMREIGVHFSVNRMLNFDCYKNRMENGLTFFEFGYMLMQSYDFLYLYRKHGVKLELGGSDQWSNIIGGYELVRKLESDLVFGMTFKLLTTASGQKMGKSEKGAIWLDREKTSPYEMFQYLRNSDDRDVIKFLKLLTMLPLEKIAEYEKLEGQELNKAKEVLAFEVVKDVHGEEAAKEALEASKALFQGGADSENIPNEDMDRKIFEEGIGILDLMTKLNLTKSNSEARRLIQGGGVSIDGEKVQDPNLVVKADMFKDDKIIIQKGKKVHQRITLV